MTESPLSITTLFHLGPVPVTTPVVTTWGLMAVLTIGSAMAVGCVAVLLAGFASVKPAGAVSTAFTLVVPGVVVGATLPVML